MPRFIQFLIGAATCASAAFAGPLSIDELFELEGQAAMVTDTAYTPDASLVLSCDLKGKIYAWRPDSGAMVWNLAEEAGNFARIAMSKEGDLAVVVGLHFVGLIDVRAGTWIKKFTLPNVGGASAVALSDSHDLVAVGDSGARIWLIDVASGQIREFASQDWGILDLRFVDDDQSLIAGDATQVRVWNVEEGTARVLVDTEAGDLPAMYFLNRVTFTDDGNFLLASSGHDAVLFNLAADELVQTFRGHEKEVVVVRTTPDLAHVITSSRDHTTRVWDTETGEVVATAIALDLSLTAAIGVSPRNDQFIMSAALFDIFGGTVRAKLGIWAIHPQ